VIVPLTIQQLNRNSAGRRGSLEDMMEATSLEARVKKDLSWGRMSARKSRELFTSSGTVLSKLSSPENLRAIEESLASPTAISSSPALYTSLASVPTNNTNKRGKLKKSGSFVYGLNKAASSANVTKELNELVDKDSPASQQAAGEPGLLPNLLCSVKGGNKNENRTKEGTSSSEINKLRYTNAIICITHWNAFPACMPISISFSFIVYPQESFTRHGLRI